MDTLEQFNDMVDMWDKNYLALFDRRIIEAQHKIDVGKIELTHWQEMKKVFLESKKINEIQN